MLSGASNAENTLLAELYGYTQVKAADKWLAFYLAESGDRPNWDEPFKVFPRLDV